MARHHDAYMSEHSAKHPQLKAGLHSLEWNKPMQGILGVAQCVNRGGVLALGRSEAARSQAHAGLRTSSSCRHLRRACSSFPRPG